MVFAGLTTGIAAQTIDTVSSSDDITADETVSAAVGSVLTIDGTGFGTAKPKVFLTDGEGKKYVLKVTGFGDEQIVAEVKKAVPGALVLNVQPKGVPEPVTFEFVTIELPVIDALLDHETELGIDSIGPNEEFMISGAFFGSKKGKILIGGKKAKVLEWLGDEIHLVMPKTLSNGAWNIVLDNKLGLDESQGITMVGNDGVKVGKASLTITIGEGPDAHTYTFKHKGSGVGEGLVIIGAAAIGSPIQELALEFPFDPESDEIPADIPSTLDSFIFSYTLIEKPLLAGKTASWLHIAGSEGLVVHVTNTGGGQVGGTFEGEVPLTLNTTGHAVDEPLVISGKFVVGP